jgi:hypothetical protein
MSNLLISIAIGAASFALGWWGGMVWYAGLPTALLGFVVAYFILAKRSFGKLQKLLKGAMEDVEKAQGLTDPQGQLRQLDKAIAQLEQGFVFKREQFLMEGIVHAQIGALNYQAAGVLMQLRLREEMQRRQSQVLRYEKQANARFSAAKEHLEAAHRREWQTAITRNWQALGMLAALDVRAGEHAKAIERMKKVKGPGSTDPLYWGILAWLHHEFGDKTDALLSVNEGMEKNADSAPLKAMANAIQNQLVLPIIDFGVAWFMFFPDQLTPDVARRMQAKQQELGGDGQGQALNRAQRRALKKQRR